jgi:hypothetical protein
MYNSTKQKGVAIKKWPLDANDVRLFKGYLKKITSEGGRRQTRSVNSFSRVDHPSCPYYVDL